MAALAAVDAYRHGDSAPTDPQAISAYLLRHERAYWHQLHARSEDRLPTTPKTMGRAVYVATLAGTLPRDDAHTALADSGVVSTIEMANQIIDDHRTCYPPVRGDVVLEPLHPDRLGEDFLALTFPGYVRDASGCDDWAATAASRLLTGVEDEGVLLLPSYTPQALTVLIEVARRWPHVAQGQLYPLLRARPWLALAAGSAAMARLASLGDIDIGALEAIEQLIPDHPHVSLMAGIAAITQRITNHRLATATDPGQRGRLYVTLGRRLAHAGQWEQALIACGEAIDIFRLLASVNPAAFERDLALSLTNIGVVLAHLGRWEEALAANAEAVEAGFRLAASGATTDLSGLAHALSSLGDRLSELGRWEEALTATTEAVEICRRLTAEDAGFEPSLATALAHLGARLSDIGRVEESLIASSEAADIFRRLAQVNSTVFEPNLAIVLNNIGGVLLRLGQREKALEIMSEAIDLRRRLAAANPASFEPDLGGSLTIFGGVLADLGRWREALEATTEAVEIYRRLAAVCMAKYEPDLGGSLVNHSASLLKLGQREEALTATTEAVEIYRRLAAVYMARFEPLLALALTNLGGQLSALEWREEALAATKESVEVYLRRARENPDEFEPRLALALNNLGSQLSALGRREEALAATTDAVNIYRRLARENPTAFEHDLAMALANLSGDLSNEERREEALTVNLEAVNVYRRLAQANPTAFEHDLAWALNNLGKMLFRLGMQDEALNAYTEAIGIYRRLARANPNAFESNLATALSNVGLLLVSLGRKEEGVTATGEAVEIYRRLAHTDSTAFRPMLAQVLRAAAAVRAVAKVELPQALDAAEQSTAIYEDLAAVHPAAFTDDLIDVLHTVADVLDGLGRSQEAAQTRHRAITTGGLAGISRVLVGDEIREELGEVGLSQVMASLFPVDCQTCGRPLGSAPPALHVDDHGSYASAGLHHSRCKTSEWNRAVSGVLIVRGTSEACLTWIARAHLLPAPNSRVTHPLPMLLVNPGLESIRLERNPSGQWRVQIETWFHNAGLRPVLRFGEPIEGA
ncbi:MAG: tetratricopeptide repeat protein, partial [Pseudonocardiaceae bacterium]